MSLWQHGELFPDRKAELMENPELGEKVLAVFFPVNSINTVFCRLSSGWTSHADLWHLSGFMALPVVQTLELVSTGNQVQQHRDHRCT